MTHTNTCITTHTFTYTHRHRLNRCWSNFLALIVWSSRPHSQVVRAYLFQRWMDDGWMDLGSLNALPVFQQDALMVKGELTRQKWVWLPGSWWAAGGRAIVYPGRWSLWGGTTASSCCRYGTVARNTTGRKAWELWSIIHLDYDVKQCRLAWITVIDWIVCGLVSQCGQTARRRQLRAKHRRTQSQGPGQLEWGECVVYLPLCVFTASSAYCSEKYDTITSIKLNLNIQTYPYAHWNGFWPLT